MLYPVQKPDVGFGEAVGSRSFPQQPDVAQGRLTIDFIALSHVSNSRDHPSITVLGLDHSMTVAAPGHSFCRIQANQIAPRDAVEHPPDFRVRIGVQVCRSSLASGAPLEIEAQPITSDVAGTVLERLDSASDSKGAVMHVGTIGEIPDLVVRPTRKAMATQRVVEA